MSAARPEAEPRTAPTRLRPLLRALAAAALLALLLHGIYGTLFGAAVAAREAQHAPAILAAIALLVLLRGAAALPAAAGWALLGSALGLAGRWVLGSLGADGWMPAEDPTRGESLAEAACLAAIAVLAWRSLPAAWAGPVVAVATATTRIGTYGQVLLPLAFEETLRAALLVGLNILAGFVAGLLVLLLAGWALAILARVPAARVAPGRVLAALAAAAAIGHMLQA